MIRWCAKHGRLVMILWSLPVSIVYFFMFYFVGISLAYWVLFVVFMTFTAWGFVHSCKFQVFMKSIKSLNEACDPYPLLDVVNERLADLKSKKHLRGLLMYKALALREMGDYTSCSEILESIDLDQKAASPILKTL